METTWVFKSAITDDFLKQCHDSNLQVSTINERNAVVKGDIEKIQQFILQKKFENVDHVFGLEQESNIFHPYHAQKSMKNSMQPRASFPKYFPREVAVAYKFPKNTGLNQKIGIIELGGGYKKTDIIKFLGNDFNPTIIDVSVNGAVNDPDDPDEGACLENYLDIEVVLDIVRDAEIRVYFAPNSSQGFYNAILQADIDKCGIISISWGNRESLWTNSALSAFNNMFADCNALIFAASGDNGSSDGGTGQNVDFPSSSPHVFGCGGTELIANNDTIESEIVWNNAPDSAAGGGISAVFAIPNYQSENISYNLGGFRGVPDASGNADPETGYKIYAERFGGWIVLGGTSAVSPLYSALFAQIQNISNNVVSAKTFLNILYANRKIAFNDILIGSNGFFVAQESWDPASGLGSPNGIAMTNLFVNYVPPIDNVEKDNGLPVWAIAVIVVASVLIFIAIVVSVVYVEKKKHQKMS